MKLTMALCWARSISAPLDLDPCEDLPASAPDSEAGRAVSSLTGAAWTGKHRCFGFLDPATNSIRPEDNPDRWVISSVASHRPSRREPRGRRSSEQQTAVR